MPITIDKLNVENITIQNNSTLYDDVLLSTGQSNCLYNKFSKIPNNVTKIYDNDIQHNDKITSSAIGLPKLAENVLSFDFAYSFSKYITDNSMKGVELYSKIYWDFVADNAMTTTDGNISHGILFETGYKYNTSQLSFEVFNLADLKNSILSKEYPLLEAYQGNFKVTANITEDFHFHFKFVPTTDSGLIQIEEHTDTHTNKNAIFNHPNDYAFTAPRLRVDNYYTSYNKGVHLCINAVTSNVGN